MSIPWQDSAVREARETLDGGLRWQVVCGVECVEAEGGELRGRDVAAVAIVVLVLHMPDVSAAAATARASGTDPSDLGRDLAHPASG